jgi:thioredoxin reductase (NADPH)
LTRDLERAGVLVRARSEIAALHGADGQLDAATLRDGERIALSYLYLFLGAAPRTEWLSGAVALDDDGFILTGPRAGAEGILETSVPSVFAVGDVRSGSVKRCATAVGEGATVVRFIHERFSSDSHDGPFAHAGIAPPPRE